MSLLIIVYEILAKVQLFNIPRSPFDLDLGSRSSSITSFIDLVTKYHWVKFHNSTVSGVRDIVNV